jgi:hypothetical protein
MDFFMHPWFMAAGGALIASPILIHLINRMRFKRIRWAAMEFLLKSQKRNRRRLIIEQLILLLLRILLVLLAGFLMARYLYSGVTDQGGTKHFAIIDTGLTMSDHHREDGKVVNALGVAKEELVRVAEEARKANSAQEMAVYTLDDLDNPIFDERLTSPSIEKLKDTLVTLKPTSLRLSPAAGLEAGHKFLVAQPQGQKVLHYFGDFRQNKWVSGPDGERTRKALEALTAAGINVNLMDAADPGRDKTRDVATNHDNLAITDLRAETRVIAEGVPVEFTVTLANYSPSARKTHLKIYVDGQEDFTGSKDTDTIPPNGTREERFTLVLPKKKPAQDIRPQDPPDVRELKRLAEKEFISVAAEIDPEEVGLNADNYRDMVIEIRKKVPALVIDGNDGAEGTGPGGDVLHLEVALNASRAFDVERRTVDEFERGQINLDLYPSVFLVNVRDIKNQAAVAKLSEYVRRGGSLAYFLGPKTFVPFYNETLNKGKWPGQAAEEPPFIRPGLFPMLLQAQPVPPLDPEKRDELRLRDEQPKIMFRMRPRTAEELKDRIPPTDPESIIVNLAPQQGAFRFLMVERYHPALPRFQWDTDNAEKVQDLIVLPNRNDISAFSSQAQSLFKQARAAADALAHPDPEKPDPKFERQFTALDKIYHREMLAAFDSGYLFRLAAALDHMLHDFGNEGDADHPDMNVLWRQTSMLSLRSQVERLIETLRYGDPLVVARPYGKGRIVACLTTAGTSSKWNDWGGGSLISWTYPVFIADLERYLTSGGDDLNRTVGDKVELKFDAVRYKNSVAVTKTLQPEAGAEPKPNLTEQRKPIPAAPQLMPELPAKEDEPKMLNFTLTSTRQPGLYQFDFLQQPGDVKEPRAYAFNIDATTESDLRRAASQDLEPVRQSESMKVGKIKLYPRGADLTVLQQKVPDASESPWLYLLILVILVVEQALAVHLSFHLRGDGTAGPVAAAAPVPA